MDVLCLSVCLSVCPVPDPKSRMEWHRKLKIARKESHDTSDTAVTPFRGKLVKHLRRRGNFGAAQRLCFTETLMSNGRLVYYDLQAESSG